MNIRNPLMTFSGECEECGRAMRRTLTKAEVGNVGTGVRVFCGDDDCREINVLMPDAEVHGNERGEA